MTIHQRRLQAHATEISKAKTRLKAKIIKILQNLHIISEVKVTQKKDIMLNWQGTELKQVPAFLQKFRNFYQNIKKN